MIKVYEYKGCGTCRKALKFLDREGIEYESIPIVERPPSKSELKKMAGFVDGGMRKLFNTSGQVYREMELKNKLDQMSSDEMADLLASNGKLVKRPFLIDKSFGTVGFKEDLWQELLT